MLVISRRKNESLVIDDEIVITVVEIRGEWVRLGIEAPTNATVHRKEVYDAIHRATPHLEQVVDQPARNSPSRTTARASAAASPSLAPVANSVASPAPSAPARSTITLTLTPKHAALVERLQNALRLQAGTHHPPAEIVAAILDAADDMSDQLVGSSSLEDLKARLLAASDSSARTSR
jgi:carbon storage regulator